MTHTDMINQISNDSHRSNPATDELVYIWRQLSLSVQNELPQSTYGGQWRSDEPLPSSPYATTAVEQWMSDLNRWVTNGVQPSGQLCGYIEPHNESTEPRWDIYTKHHADHGYIEELARSVLSIRTEHRFNDGNHRTALLSLYYVIANANMTLSPPPEDLYAMIANRGTRKECDIHRGLVDRIQGGLRRTRPSNEYWNRIAMGVKRIPLWNDIAQAMSQISLSDPRLAMQIKLLIDQEIPYLNRYRSMLSGNI
jgi:hypothetical protein